MQELAGNQQQPTPYTKPMLANTLTQPLIKETPKPTKKSNNKIGDHSRH
ncbi:hypothetical protein RRSWK_04178 [Rhodopirellula sp. SWK7]|nr:hypothetical protein RRSWK_04178 [Rhodopirellula sp. SWK7]